MAIRSKDVVYSSLTAEKSGSNPAEGIDVLPVCCALCRYWPLGQTDHTFGGVLPDVCVCVRERDRERVREI